MVEFSVTTDFKQVESMLKKFGREADKEIKKAINNTGIHGMRTLQTDTPKLTATTAKQWKWKIESGVVGNITNESRLIDMLDKGHGIIKPVKAKALIFKLSRFKGVAKSSKSSRELFEIRKKAMKSLKGKGLSPEEKNAAVIAKTGIVITNKVKATKGKNFMQPAVNKIQVKLNEEVLSALARLVL